MATQKVIPDRVAETLAVENLNKTAGGALRANSKVMNKVLGVLSSAGMKRNETGTPFFSISPNYNHSQTGNVQDLTGYAVINSLLIESSNLTNVAHWVDAAVGAGANKIDHLSFTMSKDRMDDYRLN